MIIDLLKTGESEKVEFKKSIGKLKEIVETIVAFANTNGGWTFIGVDDSETVTGIKIGKDTIEKLINSPIYVRIFDDHIEIENPGTLPQPLTVDDLREDHPSILRNPKIGKVMFLAGYIEQWGLEQTK